MEIYFNPYPSPAQSAGQALACAVGAADALLRLQKQIDQVNTISEEGYTLTEFVLFCQGDIGQYFQTLLASASPTDKRKLIGLMRTFGKGERIVDIDANNWVVCNLGIEAPILAHAAKMGAVALTIPTSAGWDIDCINFVGRTESLQNIWGQANLTALHNHYLASLQNVHARFSAQFNAVYCTGALSTAPNKKDWDSYKFFIQMERAKKSNFDVDDNLIKNVGRTKHGVLLELRCYGAGWRIFFVCTATKELVIGGFYQKGTGTDRGQNKEIENAITRINNHA